MAFWNVTTRRRTIRPIGRKQGTLPWDIPPTISVYNRLFGYPIDEKKSEYSEYCLVVVLPLSISSSLDPPEFNPGHGHQIVVDIQEEDSKEQLRITVKSFIQ